MMVIKASTKNARISDRKMHFLTKSIRGLNVERAMDILSYCSKKSSFIIKKLLRSAIANAEHNYNFNVNKLFVYTIYVTKATSFKRIMPRAKGRSTRIVKRNCHIFISLKERE